MTALENDRLIARARELHGRGASYRDIADELGISKMTVGRLLSGDPRYGDGAKRRAERAAVRLAPIQPAQPARSLPPRPAPMIELGSHQEAMLGMVFQRVAPRAQPPRSNDALVAAVRALVGILTNRP